MHKKKRRNYVIVAESRQWHRSCNDIKVLGLWFWSTYDNFNSLGTALQDSTISPYQTLLVWSRVWHFRGTPVRGEYESFLQGEWCTTAGVNLPRQGPPKTWRLKSKPANGAITFPTIFQLEFNITALFHLNPSTPFRVFCVSKDYRI